MSRPRLYGGSHVIGHDDDEELSEDEVKETEFLPQRGAMSLNAGRSRLQDRVDCGAHAISYAEVGKLKAGPFDFAHGKVCPAKLLRDKDQDPFTFSRPA